MRVHEFSVPTAYSGGAVPGTMYLPEAHGRIPVCYICPDMASSRAGPCGVLRDMAEMLADAGTAAVLFDTAGCGERAKETAAFLDQDTYDLDRVRRYAAAVIGDRLGKETLAGYGAGAVTAAWYAPGKRNIARLVLITPVLAWKNGLDAARKGRMPNPECGTKCRKEKDYAEELEYRTSPAADGINTVLHQLASGFAGEVAAVIGERDHPGTADMLRKFAPYFARRDGELSMEEVPGIGRRQGMEVPELKMRLAGAAADAALRSARARERPEEAELLAR